MTQEIYGFGYIGHTLQDLERIARKLDAVIVDVRFQPSSRNPAWRQTTLVRRFDDDYLHVGAFGNENYRGGPIKLVDYEKGKRVLESLDRPAILLCACKDPATCHRTTIMLRLAAEGFTTHELNEVPPLGPVQMALFE